MTKDESSIKLFESLKCFICDGFLQDGVQCVICEMTSCQSCTARSLMASNHCPKCLTSEPDFTKLPRNISKLLEQFRVKCRFYEKCGQVLDYKELQNHELSCSSCGQCKAKCPKCSQLYSRTAESDHMSTCSQIKDAGRSKGGFFGFFASSPKIRK